MNEYHPWEQSGETELEYFRRRFLEESGRAEAAERLLRRMEWYEPISNHTPSCPACEAFDHDGHEQGCPLAAFLAAAPPAAPLVEHPADAERAFHDLWLSYTIDDDGIHLRCSCGFDRIIGYPAPEDVAEAARSHLGAAPPEPPPLPAEVQRVVEAARIWERFRREPSLSPAGVLREDASRDLERAVAALRARKEAHDS